MTRHPLLLRLLTALFILAGAGHAPAEADDLEIASRAVVRVVSAVIEGERLQDLSTGSGFAVAPDMIVTNAHVVANGKDMPGRHFVRVIPSDGRPMLEAWLIRYDPRRDLAVLRVKEPVMPLAMYTGELGSDTEVRAFGYPGNVDRAVSNDPAELLKSMPPLRSPGIVSGWRAIDDVQMLLTTAPIARGNSGGPLTDMCGRVLGVNASITRAEGGEGSFAFAISRDELLSFLEEGQIPHSAHAEPCTSRASFADSQAKLAAAEPVATPPPSSFEGTKPADEQPPQSSSYVLALAIGGAGVAAGIALLWRRRNGWGTVALVAGLTILAAAFVTRPTTAEVEAERPEKPETLKPATTEIRYSCTLEPERSRVLHSDTADTKFLWRSDGCVNSRTQYIDDGKTWTRAFVSERQQAVTVNRLDPTTRRFVMERSYPLPLDFAKIAASQPDLSAASCTSKSEDQKAIENANSEIAIMLDASDEVLSYKCAEQ